MSLLLQLYSFISLGETPKNYTKNKTVKHLAPRNTEIRVPTLFNTSNHSGNLKILLENV